MSKYSKKVERQIREARRIAESKNRKEIKNETYQMREEKRRVRKKIREIANLEQQEKEKQKNIMNKRRNLRNIYLESLKVNDIKQINYAKNEMLKFEIYQKINEDETKDISI